MRLVGRGDLVDKPWFSSAGERSRRAEGLDGAVQKWISARDLSEGVEGFEGAGAAVAAVLTAFIGHLLMDLMVGAQKARNARLNAEIAELDKQIEKINSLEADKARFIARMEVIEKLQRSRPEIVHVFDEGLSDDGHPFLVMELLVGEDLRSRLERETRLGVGTAVAIASQILRTWSRLRIRKGSSKIPNFGLTVDITVDGKAKVISPRLILPRPSMSSPRWLCP